MLLLSEVRFLNSRLCLIFFFFFFCNCMFLQLEKEMEIMSVNEQDDLRSQAKTFASRITTCSLPAFDK